MKPFTSARWKLRQIENELCCGICMTGHDVGVPSDAIAYAHPDCEAHGNVQSDYVDLLFIAQRVVRELELGHDDALERIKKSVELTLGSV